MCRLDAEITAIEWVNDLTDQQARALAHQIGIPYAVTQDIDKLRKHIKERKRLKNVARIQGEIYG